MGTVERGGGQSPLLRPSLWQCGCSDLRRILGRMSRSVNRQYLTCVRFNGRQSPALAGVSWCSSMARKNILPLLAGGDRRTIGRADQVAAMVSKAPKLFPGLIAGMWSEDALVRMRPADT